MKQIESILLCSSPLHLLIAKVLSDHWTEIDGKSRRVTVLIVHPLITRASKQKILQLSQYLFQTTPIDVSHYFPDESISLRKGLPSHRRSPDEDNYRDAKQPTRYRCLFGRAIRLLDRYNESSVAVREAVTNYLPAVQEVYCRRRPRDVEQFVISSISELGHMEYIGIEDGIGDYGLGKWGLRPNLKWVWHKTRQSVVQSVKFMLLLLVSRDYQRSRRIFFGSRVVWKATMPDTAICDCSRLTEKFREVAYEIGELSPSRLNGDVKILIIGSVLVNGKHAFSDSDEITMYNTWIDRIVERHGVRREEIWYKPHPRLGDASYELKKEILKCQIFPLAEQRPAEIEVTRKSVEAVYSIGSSALLYARVVFGKDSFLVDSPKYRKCDSRAARLYREVAERYHIPVLRW